MEDKLLQDYKKQFNLTGDPSTWSAPNQSDYQLYRQLNALKPMQQQITQQPVEQQSTEKLNNYTPNVFTYNNSKYNFNAFKRAADLELELYLSKRKGKYKLDYINAYNELMQSLMDGTSFIQDGNIVTTKGFKNADGDKHKDFMGIAALHIMNIANNPYNMYKMTELSKPVSYDNKKEEYYGDEHTSISGVVGDALKKAMYGNASKYATIFAGEDKDGSITNRKKILASGLQNVYDNFDKIFLKYHLSEQNKALAKGKLKGVIDYVNGIKDNNITLSQLYGIADNVDFEEMFKINSADAEAAATAKAKADAEAKAKEEEKKNSLRKFYDVALYYDFTKNNPIYASQVGKDGKKDDKYGINLFNSKLKDSKTQATLRSPKGLENNIRSMLNLISQMDNNRKIEFVKNNGVDPWTVVKHYFNILSRMKGVSGGNQIIIDYNANQKIGYDGNKIYIYLKKKATTPSQQQVLSEKQGGKIKRYKYGGANWVEDPNSAIDWNFDDRYTSLYGKNKSWSPTLRTTSATSTTSNPITYDSEGNATDIELTDAYKAQRDRIMNDAAFAELYANGYKNYQGVSPDVYKDWWDDKGVFQYEKFKEGYDRLSTDLKGGPAHDFIRGKRYAYRDKDGTIRYTKAFSNPNWQETGEVSHDENGLVDTYFIDKKDGIDYENDDPYSAKSFNGDYTELSPTNVEKKPGLDLGSTAQNLFTIGAERKISNDIKDKNIENAERINKSLHANIKVVPELYKPVTGAYDKVVAGRNAAGNIYTQTEENMTADPRLNAMLYLNAHKNANEAIVAGLNADNDAIRASSKEKEAIEWQNIQNRATALNEFSEELKELEKEKAENIAFANKENAEVEKNYLTGVKNRINKLLDANKLYGYKSAEAEALNFYNRALGILEKRKQQDIDELGAWADTEKKIAKRYDDDLAEYEKTVKNDVAKTEEEKNKLIEEYRKEINASKEAAIAKQKEIWDNKRLVIDSNYTNSSLNNTFNLNQDIINSLRKYNTYNLFHK